jgi:hypothetical protein
MLDVEGELEVTPCGRCLDAISANASIPDVEDCPLSCDNDADGADCNLGRFCTWLLGDWPRVCLAAGEFRCAEGEVL